MIQTKRKIAVRIITNRADQIQNEYYVWLCGLIDRRGNDVEYQELVSALHQRDFYDLIPNDDNRVMDGVKLRDSFLNSNGYGREDDYLNGPCTVLEMMIGVALRMNFVLLGLDNRNHVEKWFWVLVHNLGLKPYLCDDSDAKAKERANDQIITNLVERKYSPTGKGSLFPLRRAPKDMRDIEIWYQMMMWIEENYPDS